MKEGYYYLITSLPELSLTDKYPGYDTLSFRAFVTEHLTPEDSRLMRTLYYPYDIENLVTLTKNTDQPWHTSANYTREEMQHMLTEPHLLPEFLQGFVNENQKQWDRLTAKALINSATTLFIDWSHTIPNRFLNKWLLFDQNLKNLLIWLNCHKFGLNPNEEVLGNHYEAEYLRNSKAGELNLKTWDFQFREALHHFDNPDIALRELIINEMRWHYLDEIIQPYSFGIEHLLTFAIRLQLINRNLTDTAVEGNERLTALINGIMHNYQLPETFSRS
ncbi:MAG: DUF2764 family protein [Cyclobacteriaceae bacterium]|nr:DUF2764 family protein [Cyclobacteriaceae bacterium]